MKKMSMLFTMSLVCNLISLAQNQTAVSDEVLLDLYRGARVTDVVDALVTCGYMDVGVMEPEIAPLWRDIKYMSHRFAGIAVTVRYGPTNKPVHPGADLTKPENYNVYRQWRGPGDMFPSDSLLGSDFSKPPHQWNYDILSELFLSLPERKH